MRPLPGSRRTRVAVLRTELGSIVREQCSIIKIKTVPFKKKKMQMYSKSLNLNNFLVPC